MTTKIKATKIGFFSDIHLGLGNASEEWHRTALDFAKFASETFEKNNIDVIIIPGDIFHNRFEVNVNTLEVCSRFFEYFKNFHVYISSGNHDSYLKDTSQINSISVLHQKNNIQVIDESPLILEIGGKTVSLNPWGTLLNEIPKTDICIGHFEIVTFMMNNFKACERGFVSKDLLEKANTIISGHFHKADARLYDDNKQIVYLGSPYQQNFGDAGDQRGLYIFDIETETFDFIPNELSPVFHKFLLSTESQWNEEVIKGNHIRLLVDTKVDSKEIQAIASKIRSKIPISFDIKYEYTETFTLNNEEAENITSVNIPDSIKIFVNDVPDLKYKEETVELLTKLYESCHK